MAKRTYTLKEVRAYLNYCRLFSNNANDTNEKPDHIRNVAVDLGLTFLTDKRCGIAVVAKRLKNFKSKKEVTNG